MPTDDSALYGARRKRNLNNGTEISSSTTLAFTSQLTSLINNSTSSNSASKTSRGRARPKKDDIFTTHNRDVAKRAKRDLEPDHAGAFAQKHTTQGSGLDASDLARSRRKLEDKARLYAAIKRGDLEDTDERYAVDFDRKWTEARAHRTSRSASPISSTASSPPSPSEAVEYEDEFGRTRTGSRRDAALAARQRETASAAREGRHDDRFTARPSAPATVLYGDTIQHEAFDPDIGRRAAMAALAAKRDRSATPPPQTRFDGHAEVRTKGTGFFQFSADEAERAKQMAALEEERAETERVRAQKGTNRALETRKKALADRWAEVHRSRAKRKANDFLKELGESMAVGGQNEEGNEKT